MNVTELLFEVCYIVLHRDGCRVVMTLERTLHNARNIVRPVGITRDVPPQSDTRRQRRLQDIHLHNTTH